MRRAGRSLLCGAFALLAVAMLSGCENPFDPLDKSSKIVGLTYIDFSITWDRWDSDPQYDGILFEAQYFNELSESLEFHDKRHSLVLEFWTQRDVPIPENPETTYPSYDRLIYSRTIEIVNSDDVIRIPIEDYRDKLVAAGLDLSAPVEVFAIVRLTPPAEPERLLVIGYPGMSVFTPEESDVTPNP